MTSVGEDVERLATSRVVGNIPWQASVGNHMEGPCGVVDHTCNPSTREAEAGGLRFPGQLRPCLKKPHKTARRQWLTPEILTTWEVD
jgi:hypothetical protein